MANIPEKFKILLRLVNERVYLHGKTVEKTPEEKPGIFIPETVLIKKGFIREEIPEYMGSLVHKSIAEKYEPLFEHFIDDPLEGWLMSKPDLLRIFGIDPDSPVENPEPELPDEQSGEEYPSSRRWHCLKGISLPVLSSYLKSVGEPKIAVFKLNEYSIIRGDASYSPTSELKRYLLPTLWNNRQEAAINPETGKRKNKKGKTPISKEELCNQLGVRKEKITQAIKDINKEFSRRDWPAKIITLKGKIFLKIEQIIF